MAIFLSASVPIEGRGDYYKDASPFLIQSAVRELVIATIAHSHIVWGGHPSITPMVWAICKDLGVEYSKQVTLYQSRYFEDRFPDENREFANVRYVDVVNNDLRASLTELRRTMLSEFQYTDAVFVGGMEGIFEEFSLFRDLQPAGRVLALPSPGGAARFLSSQFQSPAERLPDTVNFSGLFHSIFPLPRESG